MKRVLLVGVAALLSAGAAEARTVSFEHRAGLMPRSEPGDDTGDDESVRPGPRDENGDPIDPAPGAPSDDGDDDYRSGAGGSDGARDPGRAGLGHRLRNRGCPDQGSQVSAGAVW